MEGINKVRVAGMFFISVIVLLVVSFPLEGVLLIGITFTLIFYYKSSYSDKRKMRVYVATFCIIGGITIILGITSFNGVEGSLYYTEKRESVVHIDDNGDEVYLALFPEAAEANPLEGAYSVTTDCFEAIEMDVVLKINVKESKVDYVYFDYYYYLDDEPHFFDMTDGLLTVISDGEDKCKAEGKITLSIDDGEEEEKEHEKISYKIIFMVVFISDPGSIRVSIEMNPSIDNNDIDIVFGKESLALFDNDDVTVPLPYLVTAAGIIVFSWLFAIVIFFVLRRLELLTFMSLLWSMICIILLLNHIFIGLDDPMNIGLDMWFWEILLGEGLTNLLVILVASVQWALSVGIALIVVIISVKAFSSFGILIKLAEAGLN